MKTPHARLRAAFEKLCERLERWQLQNEYERKALQEIVAQARREARRETVKQ